MFMPAMAARPLRQAEQLLAAIEGGADARLFASGLAAVAALLDTVPAGGHVVAPNVMYFGAQAWLKRRHAKGSIRLTMFDQTEPGSPGPGGGAGRHGSGVDRDTYQSDLGCDRHRRGSGHRPWGRCFGWRRFHGGTTGYHQTTRVGRRFRVPFGDQIFERP